MKTSNAATRVLLVIALALAATLTAATARAQASLYVPLDDIAYRYVDALIARGELRGLSLLERPYNAGALSAGADTTLAHAHSAVVRSYAIALQTALQRYSTGKADTTTAIDDPKFIVNGDVFATGQSSGERNLMQADSHNSVTGGIGARFAMVAGPVAAMVHPILDNRLNNDPEFGGRQDRAIAGRTEDAYVSGQWRYAELFLGRMARNWGPYPIQGLQLGSAPYTYDHLYVRAGTDLIHVSALAAKLDDAFKPDNVYARYFYTHRLGVHYKQLEVGASEGYIAAGIGRSYDLSLVNPVNVYALTWRNERNSGNLSLGGNLAYHGGRLGNYTAELFLDDIQIDRGCTTVCKEPSSYGATLAAEGVPLWGDQKLFASYSRLSGLAYRTPEVAEQYSSFGVGLGQPFSDYDEARVGVDLAVVPYTTVKLYGAFRRQGQGDYHLPYPPISSYRGLPGFLMGTVEHVGRLGLVGGVMLAPGVEVTGDVGYNHVTNSQHLSGVTSNAFEGTARVQWTPRGLTF
ncbi:MAG: hypothetical protein ACR2MQ_08600 [Gemmatimonadaceae bacterium]